MICSLLLDGGEWDRRKHAECLEMGNVYSVQSRRQIYSNDVSTLYSSNYSYYHYYIAIECSVLQFKSHQIPISIHPVVLWSMIYGCQVALRRRSLHQ